MLLKATGLENAGRSSGLEIERLAAGLVLRGNCSAALPEAGLP